MKNKIFSKTISIVLILILSCFFASASTQIDSSASVKLNITFSDSGNTFAKTQVEIYKVASINSDYTFEVAADFSSYQVDISQDSSNYYTLSQTLSAYISLDDLDPTITVTTDENSMVSLEDLAWGLYLIQIDSVQKDGELHSVLPTLVALPYQNEDNSFDYEVNVISKSTVYSSTFLSSLSSKTVIKQWDDAQNESSRPDSITVALLKDGEIYDTAQLNESNNWQYTWLSLNNYSNWQVVELEVDANYTVLIENNSFVFEMINTFTQTTVEQTTTEQTTQSTTQSTTQETQQSTTQSSTENTTESGTTSVNTTIASTTQTSAQEEIPKTGTSIWLIPVFACLGICLILSGVYIKRKSQGGIDG